MSLTGNQQLALLIFAVIIVVVLGFVFVRFYRRNQHRRQVNKLLRDLARESVHDVFLPDGIEGEVWVDYLLLTDGGIVVLDVRDYVGNLFGGENINEWTQLIGVRSHKFNNPLLEMPVRVQAVRNLVGDVPVIGQVAFTHRGDFPKGMPEGVYMVDEVFEQLSHFLRPALPGEQLDQAWQILSQALKPGH